MFIHLFKNKQQFHIIVYFYVSKAGVKKPYQTAIL